MRLKQQYRLLVHVLGQSEQLFQSNNWRFVFVRDDSVNIRLEETEQRKPNPCAACVSLHERLVVSQRVVVQKETRSYVECYEHIDGVMFVSGEYEENTKTVQHPCESVK